MSLDAFIGVLLGSGISVLVTYLSHRWTKKRERQKLEIEREMEAISQIFSPLVFILNNVRDLFVSIISLHNTLQKLSETGEKQEKIVSLLSYFAVENTRSHPQALEDLLLHKSGLIKPRQFYFDLTILQSYLSTIVTFIARLVFRSDKDPLELKRYLSALAPIINQLDEAITGMREYSMAKTTQLPGYEYKQFFTEERYLELESYLNEANKILTGENITEWPLVLKRLHKDFVGKNTN